VNRKLNIVHTEASSGWGGQEIRVITELREMTKRGHRTILIAPPDSSIFRRGLDSQIETVPLSMRRRDFLYNIRWLNHFFRKEKIDVVNTHSSRDSWLAGIAARFAGVPLVVKTRHISAPVSRGWLTRLAYQRLHDFILTTSSEIAGGLVEYNGFDPHRIRSVPTGVDLDRFDFQVRRGHLREELGLPLEAQLIGIVSVLRSWKGHPDFLRAAKKVRERLPSSYFIVAGEGPRRNLIESELLEMGLEEYVFLLGHRDDIPQLLMDLDVFVLPSFANEGVPQALLQALAMRRPVVATAIGGIPEIIVSGRHGLLCEPHQPDILGDQILYMLEHPSEAKSMGEEGHRSVLEKHSLNRMTDELEKIYAQELTKERG
jgi:glycosyltransferase involved in cell wall biosynthesis